MGQLLVRHLDDRVKEKLRRRAARRGRSLEAEVRDILAAAVAAPETAESRVGSRIAARFADVGVNLVVRELRGTPARPARLHR